MYRNVDSKSIAARSSTKAAESQGRSNFELNSLRHQVHSQKPDYIGQLDFKHSAIMTPRLSDSEFDSNNQGSESMKTFLRDMIA
jgi:hypothetical protein